MGGRRVKKIAGEKISPPSREASEGKEKLSPALGGTKSAIVSGEDGPKKKARKRRERKRRGRRYQAVREKIEAGKLYPLSEAVGLVKESSYTSFDASVEAHINLGLETGKSEHQIRTLVALPHGTGKKVKVLVFAKGKEAKAASETGADRIGDEETIEKIAKSGKAAFDAVVATPEFMPKLAKIARILGPQGLMPSPKSGTVTDKPAEVVVELKKGRVELRTEKQPIIHTVIGKVSFPEKKLIENLKVIVEELNRVRPTKVKGEYIKSAVLTSTMGPGVKVDIGSF